MTIYTTRDEAIEREIIAALEAGALIASPAIDYDIERIADTVLDTDDQGCYFQSATVEEFWDAVSDSARDNEAIIKLVLEDPTAVLETGDQLPEGIVIDLWGTDLTDIRAIAPRWYVTNDEHETIVPANWYNSEYGAQDGCGQRVCARTIATASEARELVAMIRKLADEGKTANDYLADDIRDHLDELVKQAPEYSETRWTFAQDCAPTSYLADDSLHVVGWWQVPNSDGYEVTVERDIAKEEYEKYQTALFEAENEDEA